MPRKRLRPVSLDEVRITRRGQAVEFEYADEAMGGMTLELGTDVSQMSDEDLLDRHNEVVEALEREAASYEHVAIEVPIGSPQIRYFDRADQWVPRGDVLRCVVSDGGPDGEATIEIDDRVLSLRDFGRLLTTYAGWGMRIVFVPDDETHETPVIEVREPEEPEAPAPPMPPAPPRPPTTAPPRRAVLISPKPRSEARSARSERAQPVSRRPGKARGQKPWNPRDLLVPSVPMYRLRITLVDVAPPVSRRLVVSGDVSMKKLHAIFQVAMGWTNSHAHLFSLDGEGLVSDPRFELEAARDEARIKLRSFAPGIGTTFNYEYDFGDGWKHEVFVEEHLPPEVAGRLPRCIEGQGACPPEDCGGPLGYAELLQALGDPAHPDHQQHREWLGGPFDPDAFDLAAVNRRLRALR